MICGSRRTVLKSPRSRQNKWNDNREKMQTELETGSKDASEDNRSLLEEAQVENRERYDYSRFLQKFAVRRKKMQVDPDSFDYAFYTYGLSLYGNMPLIEPLESREVYRVGGICHCHRHVHVLAPGSW